MPAATVLDTQAFGVNRAARPSGDSALQWFIVSVGVTIVGILNCMETV
jgi:hypothetical protein